MFIMDYVFCLVMMLLVIGAVALCTTSVSYYGVLALMSFAFLCCVFMGAVGRTFVALVTFIVYLGGLVVVFSYCVSVEKGGEGLLEVWVYKFFMCMVICLGIVVYLGLIVVLGLDMWLVMLSQDVSVYLEVSGFGVLYSGGGGGLVVCAWGLLVTLFSILVVLSWYRLGALRSF
uniref:NADH-ubiquinone oxidoreductase chain 6 n=1 Tax=Rhinophis philippinus TaxID=196471 RepID=D2W938_9SAUR|nr:NADH dehydrogenase subunit 6 [Rhinophis philippinus]